MNTPLAHELLGTGVAFPFRGDGRGRIALASGEADVEQAIRIILSTAPGDRPMRPEFGCDIHEFVFDQADAATFGHMDRAIRRALDRWEPRISVTGITFDEAQDELGMLLVDIRYELRTSSSPRNLIYPFYLVPAGAPS
jgi:phage baseplate assembly protein W